MKNLEELQAELEKYKEHAAILAHENAELRKQANFPERHEEIIFYGMEARILKWVYSDNFRKYIAKQVRGIKAQNIDDNMRLQMIDMGYSLYVDRPECLLWLVVHIGKSIKKGYRDYYWRVKLIFDYSKFEPVSCEVYK